MSVLLVINAGSSSIKFALYRLGETKRLLRGEAKGLGGRAELVVEHQGNRDVLRRWSEQEQVDHARALGDILGWIATTFAREELVAVGHRIVHGGAHFAAPVLLTPEVMTKLEGLVPLAPLHQTHNLAAVQAVAASHPELPQIACFDTAFHRGHASVVDRFALPRSLYDEGVRRYGFHGLSYEYIAGWLQQEAPTVAGGAVVVAHLGSGASLCALRGGRSVDTTMGMTALDGLPMGTRPGSLDPGVLLYLLQEKGLTPDALETLLYHQSGLLGISGISADMRLLAESADPRAAEARALFALAVTKAIAAMAASMGGLEALVFTGGIGTHDSALRAWVCNSLAWLGVVPDLTANSQQATAFAAPDSRVALFAVSTDEELVIARHSQALLAQMP